MTFLIAVFSVLFSVYCYSEIKVIKLKMETETVAPPAPMDINELAEKLFDFPVEGRSSKMREEDLV
jgi:hypothetical protein